MRALGIGIMVVGAALLVGNISGMFRTFPFAGAIVIAIGAAISRAG